MGKVVHCIHRQELSTAYAYEREDHPTCKQAPIFVFLQPLLVSSTLGPFRILWLFLLQAFKILYRPVLASLKIEKKE